MTTFPNRPPKLLDQMQQELRTRGYALRTERTYLDWARKYILHHNKRHPKDMGADEINAYLSHLANHENVAASTQNQALSALLFLYNHVITTFSTSKLLAKTLPTVAPTKGDMSPPSFPKTKFKPSSPTWRATTASWRR